MSSDTAKENASVVDSSVTEWKQDMGNSDDPESPSYKGNEDGCYYRAEKSAHDRVVHSHINKKSKLYNTRYFIIKSLNHDNIQLSVKNGVWATQVMNEPILEEAFHNSGKVILIFSVNMSGYFQGYAQMVSSVGWRHDNIWSQRNGRSNHWGRSFEVTWLQLNDLPFQKTLHLKNPLNDFKPVKISRDCQELPEDIGEALCELIDGEGDGDAILRSDGLSLKRPCIEFSSSMGDGEYNAPPLHMSWAPAPLPYPNFLYQHRAEANRFHLARQGSASVTFPETLPVASGMSKAASAKHSRTNGKLTKVNCDVPSRVDVWGLPSESPLASTLTDDDLLDMTYEEYLEAHSRSFKHLSIPMVGRSWTMQDPSSKQCDNDLNSSHGSDRSCSRKQSHHSSEK